MESHKLHTLAARFWQGELSDKEEALLREAVRYGESSPELEPLKAYFDVMEQEKEERQLGDDFDEMIQAQIAERKQAKVKPMFLMRIAAGIVLLLGLGYTALEYMPLGGSLTSQTVTHDSYAKPGPAYKQVKSALFMMSTNLNIGLEATSKIGKINEMNNQVKGKR